MRTTVDLNPDLLDRVRKLADREGISFKDALNRVVTRGLAEAPVTARQPYVLPKVALGIPKSMDARRMKEFLAQQDFETYLRVSGGDEPK
jgi:hypothetical protein